MSAVYFHSKSHVDARLAGSERAYMGSLITHQALNVLYPLIHGFGVSQNIKDYLTKDCYLLEGDQDRFKQYFETWFRCGDGYLTKDGVDTDLFSLQLNTALVFDNDAIKLMARLHGQCERHAYFLPKDFDWVIRTIEFGLEEKIYRRDQGWESVIALFKLSDSPIVCSYSVCDSFPNQRIAKWEDDYGGDDWYDLDFNTQWDLAFEKLEVAKGKMQIQQNDHIGMGSGKTAFDFINT